MRYMIHSAPERSWYVDEFLIPEMLRQGISQDEIVIRCDTEKKGNLISCMEAFQYCGEHPDEAKATWHLQDDIALCRDFADRTKDPDLTGVVCGIVVKDWGPNYTKIGLQPVEELWYSFQCIRIPDRLAGECAKWFFEDAMKRKDPKYANRVARRKHDDDFFRFFLLEKYPKAKITNLKPNLVEHIDYMLGGSLINAMRERKVNRSAWWDDEDLVENLEIKIQKYREDQTV